MTYNQIKPYIEKGLISEQSHPLNENIKIFNYTQRCQFSREWDDITKQCRGLIIDVKSGKILARPFPKFFNYEEHIQNAWPIPSELPIITEKYDGSLGILYWLPGDARPWIATRGSFMSEQAQWATEWFRKNVAHQGIPRSYTHLFEIIYPQNRIVVSYDFEGLILLSIRVTESGGEVKLHETIFDGYSKKLKAAKRIPHTSLTKLHDLAEDNKEGFVIFYPEAGVRMKIKFKEYVRLHRLITGFSSKSIWECLSTGKGVEEVIDKVPDEFFEWVRKTENKLRADWAAVWGKAQLALQMVQGKATRREQAEEINAKYRHVSSIVFLLLDNKTEQAAQSAWRMVKPKYELPFKKDIDG